MPADQTSSKIANDLENQFEINGTYRVNEDGTVDVYGDVEMRHSIGYRSYTRFGRVTGSFKAGHVGISSLEGFPQEVGGDLDISGNNIRTLQGCPSKVRNFYASENSFVSLEGGPIECGGNYHVFDCSLTSLKGAPRIIPGDFVVFRNDLMSLEGAPETVGGSFDFQENSSLTSLKGGPRTVGRHYMCYNMSLTSLVGAPSEIPGDMDCHSNEIESLVGGPSIVKGRFRCHANKIKDFQGCPQGFSEIWAYKNPAISLSGIPKVISGDAFLPWNPNTGCLRLVSMQVGGKMVIYDDNINEVDDITWLLERSKDQYPNSLNRAMMMFQELLVSQGFTGNARY